MNKIVALVVFVVSLMLAVPANAVVVPGVPPVKVTLSPSAKWHYRSINKTPGCVTTTEYRKIAKSVRNGKTVTPNSFYRVTAAQPKVVSSVRSRSGFNQDVVVYRTCNSTGQRTVRVVYQWLGSVRHPSLEPWVLVRGGKFVGA
jgi:hypothetical protein